MDLADFHQAIMRMVSGLKPGGWLVLEEPDFSAARSAAGPARLVEVFDRVNVAIEHMFRSRGMDYALGLKLPQIAQEAGFNVSHVEHDTPLAAGRSSLALMMRSSAEQLRDKYVSTNVATSADVDVRFTPDQSGTFHFRCEYYCGQGHEEMVGHLVVQ